MKKTAAGVALLILLWLVVEAMLLPRGDEFLSESPVKTSVMSRRASDAKSAKRSFILRYQYVPLTRIAPALARAVIEAEDAHFFVHHGFDWEAMALAVETAWKKKKFPRGASTLTQQLAKNLYFSLRKDPLRKIREGVVTMRLERHLGKRRILELYLNVAEWGDGVFGAEAAARYYFRKSAATLTPTQAATLAAMLPGPLSSYNLKKHPERVHKRTQIILRRMSGGMKGELSIED